MGKGRGDVDKRRGRCKGRQGEDGGNGEDGASEWRGIEGGMLGNRGEDALEWREICRRRRWGK